MTFWLCSFTSFYILFFSIIVFCIEAFRKYLELQKFCTNQTSPPCLQTLQGMCIMCCLKPSLQFVKMSILQFVYMMRSFSIVLQCSYFNSSSLATMKLAGRTRVLTNHLQYCEHYGNEIKCLLEQSLEFFNAVNPDAFSASKKNNRWKKWVVIQ